MKLDPAEQKGGISWFIGSGVFLVFLVSFIIWADNYLSTSDREIRLEATLKELRGAQTSLPSGVSDSRQKFQLAARPYDEVGEKNEASSSAHHE